MPTAPLFDEASARLDTFDENSIPVAFPHAGLTLYIPRPNARYRRQRDDQGKATVVLTHAYDADVVAIAQRMDAASTDSELIAALMDLAEALLRRNYAVPDDATLDALLVFVPPTDGEPWPEPWATFLDLARMLTPRPVPPRMGE